MNRIFLAHPANRDVFAEVREIENDPRKVFVTWWHAGWGKVAPYPMDRCVEDISKARFNNEWRNYSGFMDAARWVRRARP
jgi:hypothetical protein